MILQSARNGSLQFSARDVTGTHELDVSDVQPSTPAGAVAAALAERMSLPHHVPWTLRDGRSSRLLVDDRPLGDQIEPEGETLTVMPKAHLG